MSSVTAQVPTMSPMAERPSGETGPAPLLLLDRAALKALMKEAVCEVLQEQREAIASFLIETYEDACLMSAMEEGMESEDVPVEDVLKTLEEMRCAS